MCMLHNEAGFDSSVVQLFGREFAKRRISNCAASSRLSVQDRSQPRIDFCHWWGRAALSSSIVGLRTVTRTAAFESVKRCLLVAPCASFKWSR